MGHFPTRCTCDCSAECRLAVRNLQPLPCETVNQVWYKEYPLGGLQRQILTLLFEHENLTILDIIRMTGKIRQAIEHALKRLEVLGLVAKVALAARRIMWRATKVIDVNTYHIARVYLK